MNEVVETRAEGHGTLEGVPLPKRVGTKGMMPSTWLNRGLRIEYTDAYGGGQETSGTLLDWCPLGPVLNIRGARTLITWERLCVVELVDG